MGEPASDEKVPSTWALRAALVICCLTVLVMGVVPAFFMGVAEAAVKILGS
jgi:NADH:ubiquinone oxidoreductase subunit 2 (subunit N)